MIGLSVLGALGIWLIVAIFLSKKIPQWFGIIKYKTVISMFIFPLIVLIPVADDLIGMWQFRKLCKKEAVVTLTSDWKNVKRAKMVQYPVNYIDQYIIPIRSTGSQYIDIDRNASFMTYRMFSTSGGFLRRNIQVFGASSCHPENTDTVNNEINLDLLIKNGEFE